MINGRHLLLLGLLACAGLISVHDGQGQTDCCYKIAAQERDLRQIREKIELEKIKHNALQSPRAVMERAAVLNLKVVPFSFSVLGDGNAKSTPTTPTVVPHTLGTPQGERPITAPNKPTILGTPTSGTSSLSGSSGVSIPTTRRSITPPATVGH